MHITLIANEKRYQVGDIVPEDVVVSEVPYGELLLIPGEVNPEGEEVLIPATAYEFNRRIYELDTYAIKAVVRDGTLVPMLRQSRGQEKYALTKLVKKSPRHQAERVGELVLWWPITEKTIEAETSTDKFVDEAVNTVEELGDDITENFVFSDEPLEYIEDTEYFGDE